MDLEQMALDEGFLHASVIPAAQVPFEESFRVYCEENLCGQYGVNYSCPPTCGSCKEMQDRVYARDKALVVQSIWDMPDYNDKDDVRQAKLMHNTAMLHLVEQMREEGLDCLSAYCVFVKELADKCGMEYNCGPGKVAFFGMIMYN